MRAFYKPEKTIEQIYSGGPVAVSNNEEFLVCINSTKLNLLDLKDGSVRKSIGEVKVMLLVISLFLNFFFFCQFEKKETITIAISF